MKMKWLAALLAIGGLGLFLIGHSGCELSSASSATRNVGVDYSGVYTGQNANAQITDNQSGDPITFLNLRQSGDQLSAIEDHNLVFTGTVGDPNVNSGNAESTFSLQGKTTAGNAVTISGTLSGVNSGSSALGTMRGTWIEPNLYGNVYATAQISPIVTNSPTPTTNSIAISPTTANLTANGQTAPFSASGGSGSFNWSFSPAAGTLSSTTGSSVTYTRTAAGTVTLTVADANNASFTASAVITQQ